MSLPKQAYTAHLVICTPTCTSEHDNYWTPPPPPKPSSFCLLATSFCPKSTTIPHQPHTPHNHHQHHPSKPSPHWGTKAGGGECVKWTLIPGSYLSYAEPVFKPSCDSLLLDLNKHGEDGGKRGWVMGGMMGWAK